MANLVPFSVKNKSPACVANGNECDFLNVGDSSCPMSSKKECSFNFKRLCWAEEWELACKEDQKSGLGLKNILGGWEWTRTSVYVVPGEQVGGKGAADNEDWLAIIRGKESCSSLDKKDPGGGGIRPGRCCK